MATVTRTFVENQNASNKSTWTVTISSVDQTVSGDFTIATPSCSLKYVGSNKGQALASIGLSFKIGEDDSCSCLGSIPDPYGTAVTWASGVTKTLTFNPSDGYYSAKLNNIFNSSNRTVKTLPVDLIGKYEYAISLTSLNPTATTLNEYISPQELVFGTVGYITLDVPPTATLGTPTYATPQYAGLGVYTVPITSAKAYYGGNILKVTLTVGQDSTVQTYSSTTITNKTISVTPTVAGTYTPTITIEDSRGQTTTNTLPQIVVNPYLNPSLGFDVVRTNNNGVRNDEGAYGLITANVSFIDAIADIRKPTVKINGTTTNNVTWYSAYNASTGVSSAISDWSTVSSGDTIYGLINGSFAQTDSYQITVILKDSLDGASSAITQILSTAFYTIDFKAGGKEIAFGAPANDNLTTNQQDVGLFKCEMESRFNNISQFNNTSQFNSRVIVTNLIGEIKMYSGLVIPTGWLLCDGSEVLIEDYPLLNNALGGDSDNNIAATLWGTASNSNSFVLPNFVGRMPLGASDINTTEWITITGENEYSTFTLNAPTYARWGTGDTWLYKILEPGDYSPTYTNMNELFGGDPASGVAKCLQVALNVASNGGYSWWRPSVNDMPTHLHSQPDHNHYSGLYTVADRFGSGSRDAAGAYTGYGSAVYTGNAHPNTNNAGGGRYISQMPPFAVINYIICAV